MLAADILSCVRPLQYSNNQLAEHKPSQESGGFLARRGKLYLSCLLLLGLVVCDFWSHNILQVYLQRIPRRHEVLIIDYFDERLHTQAPFSVGEASR